MKFLLLPILLAIVACSTAPGPVVPKNKTERKSIGFVQKFDRWDENGDGQLRGNELKEAERISGHTRAQLLAIYDTDHSGGISLSEAQEPLEDMDEVKPKTGAKR